jgi:hypothetical protein
MFLVDNSLSLRYLKDISFYLGILKKDEDPGYVTVLLNDYGIKDTVDSRDIRRKIMVEEIPVVSMRCRIHNIRPVGCSQKKKEWLPKNSRIFS